MGYSKQNGLPCVLVVTFFLLKYIQAPILSPTLSPTVRALGQSAGGNILFCLPSDRLYECQRVSLNIHHLVCSETYIQRGKGQGALKMRRQDLACSIAIRSTSPVSSALSFSCSSSSHLPLASRYRSHYQTVLAVLQISHPIYTTVGIVSAATNIFFHSYKHIQHLSQFVFIVTGVACIC